MMDVDRSVSLRMFQLDGSYRCDKDFLEIREGNSTGPLVNRLCGNSLPSNYTSVIGHILWIRFRSDSSISGAGFRATFSHCESVTTTGRSLNLRSSAF